MGMSSKILHKNQYFVFIYLLFTVSCNPLSGTSSITDRIPPDFKKLTTSVWEYASCIPPIAPISVDQKGLIHYQLANLGTGLLKQTIETWNTSNTTCGNGSPAFQTTNLNSWSYFQILDSVSEENDPSGGQGIYYLVYSIFLIQPNTTVVYVDKAGENIYLLFFTDRWLSKSQVLNHSNFLSFSNSPTSYAPPGASTHHLIASNKAAPPEIISLKQMPEFNGDLSNFSGTYQSECRSLGDAQLRGQYHMTINNGQTHIWKTALVPQMPPTPSTCNGANSDIISTNTAFNWLNYGKHPTAPYSLGYHGGVSIGAPINKGYYMWIAHDASIICYNTDDTAFNEFNGNTPPNGSALYDDFVANPFKSTLNSNYSLCLYKTN